MSYCLGAGAGRASRLAGLDWQEGAARRAELLLIHDGAFANGAASRWQAVLPGVSCHHLRSDADYARVVRLLTGRAVGLVLSGGGARGFAHLGVVRALREHGVPIDLVGGTSMGGILAAGVAADWSDAELVERFRRSFVDTNPLSDFTLPFVSLVSGRKVGQLLRRELGEIDIEDLPLPFFCVSSNLTTGRIAVHQQGPLWRWLRASPSGSPASCRGIPRRRGFRRGGVMNNLPVDVMRAKGAGRSSASTSARTARSRPTSKRRDAPFWNLLLGRRGGRRGRICLQILWRSGMVNSAKATMLQTARATCCDAGARVA